MKKFLEILFLVSTIGSSFLAGTVDSVSLSIILLIVAICSQIINVKIQSNIIGEGVHKISVTEKEPIRPKKGDLWVDTSKK